MKSITMLLAVSTILFVALPVSAQHAEHHAEGETMISDSTAGTMQSGMMSGGMMQGGMMGGQGMMNNCPMCGMMGRGMMTHNIMSGNMMGHMGADMKDNMDKMDRFAYLNSYHKLINKLPRMQSELSLTDSQVKELEQLKINYQKRQIDLKASLQKQLIDLKTQMDNNPTAAALRKSMNNVAGIRIDISIHTFETAQTMKDILDSEQKEKLASLSSDGMMMGMMK